MGKGELVVYEGGPTDIAVARPPDVVLEEAHKAAKALMDVMGAKKKKVMMNGEQYLEFEDWQTVGRFYGVTVKVTSTEFIDYGGAKGFLAKASVLRHDGAEISAAEAMCLNDEEKWSTRTKYEWKEVLDANGKMIWEPNPNKPGKMLPKKEKVKVGEESVPLFQLRSMAQTRACAKALRNVLAWVVVLAGYRPTPAEEIDGISQTVDQGKQEESLPQTHVSTPPTAPQTPPEAPKSAPPTLTPPQGEAASSAEQNDARNELAIVCSKIADILKTDAGTVLYDLTINKAGKFGKRSPTEINWEANGPKGVWYPLKAVLSKAKAQLKDLEENADISF